VSPEIVALFPDPVVVFPAGVRVKVHVPVSGNPFRTTLPVDKEHVGWVITPTRGAEGAAFTDNTYVSLAAMHGEPEGLSVVTVIVTFWPASPSEGVYVKSNGLMLAEAGLTDPVPFEVIATLVALPPKVFPLILIEVFPQTLPFLLLKVTVGGFEHPHDTRKPAPVVIQPAAFFTEMV
jgi:hypothetical protein